MIRVLRPIIVLLVLGGLGYYGYLHFSSPAETPVLTGYIEGDLLHLAVPVSGPLQSLSVGAGERVAPGDPLFAIDTATIDTQLAQAQAAVAAAQARLSDAREGQRPQELAVIEARREGAQATYDDAASELARVRELAERGTMAQARLDQAQAAAQTAQANLEQVTRELEAARLGARQGQIDAARAELSRAEAAQAEIEARRAQTHPTAPAAGRIDNVYFQTGEWVPANQPVIALLPDNAVHIRFFAPEPDLSLYAPGTTVRFTCDSCAGPQSATISSVAAEPEFTPPVIYSRSSRDTLVFEVEARPETPFGLAPGQPVDVIAPEAGA